MHNISEWFMHNAMSFLRTSLFEKRQIGCCRFFYNLVISRSHSFFANSLILLIGTTFNIICFAMIKFIWKIFFTFLSNDLCKNYESFDEFVWLFIVWSVRLGCRVYAGVNWGGLNSFEPLQSKWTVSFCQINNIINYIIYFQICRPLEWGNLYMYELLNKCVFI